MENWKPIRGWEGFYEVSDRGRVRSLTRTVTIKNPWGVLAERTYKGRMLDDHVSKSGYRIVALTRPGQKPVSHNVHTLVLTTFVGPAPEGLECCHGEGGATVNALSNLRWGTRSSNALDRHRDGTMNPPSGEDHAIAKLDDEAVRYIRLKRGRLTQRGLGAMFGVSHTTIGQAQRGQAWRHVT